MGSPHIEVELGVLLARAQELPEYPTQGVLDLGIEANPPVTPLSMRSGEPALFSAAQQAAGVESAGPARVVGTDSRLLLEALAGDYDMLRFVALADELYELFRDPVSARVVEPTSMQGSGRVLSDLRQRPAGCGTMKRTMAQAAEGGYRDESRHSVLTGLFGHSVGIRS